MKKNLLFFCLAMAATAANAITYVRGDASDAGNGTSWTDAFTTIADGINATAVGDTVYVAGGTYNITASLPKKAVKIYGGFKGDEANPDPEQRKKLSEKPWDFVYPTVVDASGTWEKSDDRIFATDNFAVNLTIDGLVLQGRTAGRAPVMYIRAGLVMQNCIVQNNVSNETTGDGGVIMLHGGNTGAFLIKDCKIYNNIGGADGGGICIAQSNATISVRMESCLFSENSGNGGGGFYMRKGDVVAENCEFISNNANNQGGAIRIDGGSLALINCIMAKNKSGMASDGKGNGSGAAVYRNGGTLSIFSCVAAENGSDYYNTPVAMGGNDIGVYNTIFYNNDGAAITGSNVSFYNNIVTGALPTAAYSGENILYSGNGSDLFTDAANGVYTLTSSSVAKGAGKCFGPCLGQADIGISGSSDGWSESPYYYIQFATRTMNVLQDMGSDQPLLSKRAYPGAEGDQQWRLIRSGEYFKVQSKTGNYLKMNGATLTAANSSEGDELLFKFELTTGSHAGFVQLRGSYPAFGSVVNKANVASFGEKVDGWSSSTTADDGNDLAFIPVEAMPKLDTWYQIYALGGKAVMEADTKLWQGNGVGQKISHVLPDDTVSSQLWKLVAATDGVKIQSAADDSYFKKQGSNEGQTNTEVDGDVFTLEWSEYDKNIPKLNLQQRWSLYNVTANRGANGYLATSTEYWGNSADREVEFVPVPVPSVALAVDTVSFGSYAQASAAVTKAVAVTPRFVTQGITTEIKAIEDANQNISGFSVEAGSEWNSKKGGALNVTFTPTSLSEGEYAAMLIVKGVNPVGEASDTVVLTATVAEPVQITVNKTDGVTVTSPTNGSNGVYTLGKGTVVVEFTIPSANIVEATVGTVNPSPLTCVPLGGGQYRITVENVQADTAITISLVAIYQVSAEPANPEYGSVTGAEAGSYVSGTTVTLTATATDATVFTSWKTKAGAEVSTDNPLDILVTQDSALVAHFALKTYSFAAASSNPSLGSIASTPGNGTYDHGTAISLTATPTDTALFVNWTSGNEDEVSTAATLNFTLKQDTALTANFALKPKHEVSVIAENQQYGSVTGGGLYFDGFTATLTATATDSTVFTGWTTAGGADVVSSENPLRFDVTQDSNFVAHFALKSYSFAVAVNDASLGNVSSTPANGTYAHGAAVALTATPADTALFVSWTNTNGGEVVSTEATLSFALRQPAALTANFVLKDKYTVTASVSAESEEYGSVSGSGVYFDGATATLTATPANSEFTGWKNAAGDVVSTENPLNILVTQDTALIAVFAANLSSNSKLSSLTVSGGAALSPAFNPDSLSYTVAVANSVASITLTAQAAHTGATVEGSGVPYSLAVGANELSVVVTAEDGVTTTTYTVTVTRAAAPPTAVAAVATSALSIYPNPVSDGALKIKNGGLKAGEKVEVYSLSATLVAAYEVAAGPETVINISHLPQGTYIVKVGAYSAKVVVE
ncbi:MAG: cadherin-like beta sandwich domain-containing protein [Prevotellaceae bacterium]|jgi:hypothetical protein|nr:cadherin-like beta sandwich domain-containing protein [Prevotellaceae bacterium]